MFSELLCLTDSNSTISRPSNLLMKVREVAVSIQVVSLNTSTSKTTERGNSKETVPDLPVISV